MFVKNLKNFNWKLFITLIFITLIPSIYLTIRMFFLGEFDDPYSYSIAAQVSWINIFYEVLNEAIIIPLFFLISKRKGNFQMLVNRIKTGFYLNFIIYLVTTLILIAILKPLLNFMIEDEILRDKSQDYIFLELISSFFYSLFKYILVIWMILNKNMRIIISFITQMFFIILFDTFFISKLSISLNLSIIGIAISNILSSIILLLVNIFMLFKYKINIFIIKNLNFKWMIQYWRIGLFSGFESLVRNLFFSYMILKILNDVSGSGNYWITNGFIWSWLLVPILTLSNVIKSQGENDKKNIKQIFSVYLFITTLIIFVWIITIPTYGLFIKNVLNVDNYLYISKLVLILLPFYIVFAYNSIIDGIMISWGRTDLLLYQSIFANICIYVPYFILLKTGVWIPTVEGIAIMFGMGILLDSIITMLLFILIVKFKKELIFNLNRKTKENKNFIFGIPTAGKSYFNKQNKEISWDSEVLYQLTSTLVSDDYNSFIVDPNLSKKIISITNRKMFRTEYKYILYSVLPIELYEEIDWLIYKGANIFFINRTGNDFKFEWDKRNNSSQILTLEEANLCSSFIEEQANFFDAKLITLKEAEYISDIYFVFN